MRNPSLSTFRVYAWTETLSRKSYGLTYPGINMFKVSLSLTLKRYRGSIQIVHKKNQDVASIHLNRCGLNAENQLDRHIKDNSSEASSASVELASIIPSMLSRSSSFCRMFNATI